MYSGFYIIYYSKCILYYEYVMDRLWACQSPCGA
jgi:hypothetical protein